MKTGSFSLWLNTSYLMLSVINTLSCGKIQHDKIRIFVDEDAYQVILQELEIQQHGAILNQENEFWIDVSPEKIDEISSLLHEALNRCGGFFADDGSVLFTHSEDLMPASPLPLGLYTVRDSQDIDRIISKIDSKRLLATMKLLSGFKNRYYTSSLGVSSQKWIFDQWTELTKGRPDARVSYFNHQKWNQPSVILSIPGKTVPEEKIILGGHADSIQMGLFISKEKMQAPGADDNASGIAVLTEVIRLFMEENIIPDRTIEFMAYAAEEVGLKGSKEIAEYYYARKEKVMGVLQLDMTAYAGSPAIGVITDYTDPDLTQFSRLLIDRYVKSERVDDRCGYACSDHASWTRVKYPAVTIHETSVRGNNKKIHSKSDTMEYIDLSGQRIELFARLALAFALELGSHY